MALQNDSLILKSLNKHKNFLDQNIKKYLKKLAAPQEIIDIMSYAVLGGGKRIRPFLLAEFAKLYGVKANIYKYPCMAIELAHCFSLIYDDLPCMDNDDLRRGKPTVHKAYNEANALLGGASLLVYSFKLLSLNSFKINNNEKLRIINNFADVTGAEGVLSGQYLDLLAENEEFKLTMSNFKEIQTKKTSLLIAFSTHTGALLGRAKKKEQKEIFEIGLLIGRIFQIKDDILDLEGSEKEMGKKVNKDKSLNKATIIRLKDINFAKREVKKLSLKVKEKLNIINKNTENLATFINFLENRKG
jgi:geranylgeranyl pyrophosphate synthase